MDTIAIGLLGGGTVGSGVVRVLRDNAPSIEAKLGARLKVARILVSDIDKARDPAVDAALLTTNAADILDDADISIVVELIGGTTTAAEYILRAIENGKHIVTANKALLASRGPEIFAAASASGVDVFYEGAVCGGIPIIRALRESLASERIESLVGIVNGTTNFILSAMSESGAAYDETLKEAMDRGYAEADPTADVGGHDAAQKLAILASLGFGAMVTESDVYVEGIEDVTPADIKAAQGFGYEIKPLAIAQRVETDGESSIAARVHAAWVAKSSMLAHVGGVFNAVRLQSDGLGSSMFYGQGAGQLPTGSAVLADIIDVARNIRIGAAGRVPHLATREDQMGAAKVLDIGQTQSAFYLRFTVADVPGVLGTIATALGAHGISLRIVHQESHTELDGAAVPVVVITHPTRESALRDAVRSVDGFESTKAPTRWMRIVEGGPAW